jgi:hypothetical protein
MQSARHPPDGAAAATAGQFLWRAVGQLALDRIAEPIVIADYGSSQGKNSPASIRAAIGKLRSRPRTRFSSATSVSPRTTSTLVRGPGRPQRAAMAIPERQLGSDGLPGQPFGRRAGVRLRRGRVGAKAV